MPDENLDRVAFRPGPLARDLEVRAAADLSVGLVAKRDLERYYEALRRSLPTFTEQEAMLLLDALNGTLHEPHTVPLMWASVDDAILLDGLDKKFAVDGKAFVERLRALTYAEALAVVDAIERAWRMLGVPDQLPMPDALRKVGLVK